MNISKKGKKKAFLVVQFNELPFEGIDKYVCVPYSWVIFCKTTDQVALVAYPKDEDPYDTRARVKRRETYKKNLNWRFYTASIKNKSDSYKEAEMWISRRNCYGRIEGEDLDKIDSGLEPVLDIKLHSATQSLPPRPTTEKPQLAVKPFNNPQKPIVNVSIKQPAQSESKEEINENQSQQDMVANSADVILNQTRMVPGCSEREKSIVIQDNKLIHSSWTEKNAEVSNYEKRFETNSQFQHVTNSISPAKQDSPKTSQSASSKPSEENNRSPVCEENGQVSMPAMDVDQPTEVRHVDQVEPESIMKEKSFPSKSPLNALKQRLQPELVHQNEILLPHLYNILKEPCTQKELVGQSKEANNNSKRNPHHSSIEPTSSNTANNPCQSYHQTRLPHFTANDNAFLHFQPQETYTEVTHNDQRSRPCDILSNTHSTSHYLPHSAKSSRLFGPLSKKPSSSVIKNYAKNKTCLQNVAQTLSVALQSETQSSSSSTRCVEKQHPPVTQKLLHKVSRVPEMYVGNSTGNNYIDNGASIQRIANNTSAAHNLSILARQLHCNAEQSHDQQYLHSQEDYLQRIAREQDISYLLRRSNEVQSVDQTGFFQDAMMNRQCPVNNRSKPVNKPSQFLSQSHGSQYQPDYLDYLQLDQRSQELLRKYTKEMNTGHNPYPQYSTTNVPSSVQNSSNLPNQFHQNYELPNHKQVQKNHQDLQSNSCTRVNSNSQRPGLQGVTKRTPPLVLPKNSNFVRQSFLTAHRNYLLQESRTQQNVNERFYEPNNMDLAADPQNVPMAPTPVIPNFEILPTCSSDQSCKRQFTAVCENPRKQKRVIDQSSETNFTAKHGHFDCETIKSPVIPNSPKVVENLYHIDTCLMERPLLPHQKVVDHEVITNHEIVSNQELISDREMFIDKAPSKKINDDISTEGRIFSENVLENTQIAVQNPMTLGYQHVNPRTITKQQMLNEFATLVSQLGASMSNTRDLFNNLRSSILESNEKYKRLLGAVNKFNAMENHMNIACTSGNTTPVFPKVGKNIPNGEEKKGNSGNGEAVKKFYAMENHMNTVSISSNTTPVFPKVAKNMTNGEEEKENSGNGEAVKKLNVVENHMNTISTSINTTPVFPKVATNMPSGEEEKENSGNGDDNVFVLPPEYDSNDSKWTLKYRENGPGLIELVPESGVYVSGLQLERCKRVSEDCKTLAQLLLTEIFSDSALSVCSLTGVKTKASNNVEIKVRPGLDGFASMVLLTFVEEYGLENGWDTSDTQGIICSLSSKIQDMRAKNV